MIFKLSIEVVTLFVVVLNITESAFESASFKFWQSLSQTFFKKNLSQQICV
jgi:hypothetical protein